MLYIRRWYYFDENSRKLSKCWNLMYLPLLFENIYQLKCILGKGYS